MSFIENKVQISWINSLIVSLIFLTIDLVIDPIDTYNGSYNIT